MLILDSSTTLSLNSNCNPENLYAARYEGVVVDVICSQGFLFGDDMKYTRKSFSHPCDYCGGIAKYHFKNGKYCCKNYTAKCSAQRKINSEKLKILCQSPEVRKARSEAMIGEKNPNYGKIGENNPGYGKKRSKEFCENQSKRMMGKNNPWYRIIGKDHPSFGKRTKEFCKNQSKRMLALGDNHPFKTLKAIINHRKAMRTPECRKKKSEGQKALGENHHSKSSEFRKKRREYMLGGGAAYLLSFIKNPSKPQVELFELIKFLYPTAILNHPSLNFSIDIAIPDKMIAIEYDCWYWHDEERDKIRQKELETIGWRFLRYQDYMPNLNELKKDLKGTLK